MRRVFLRPFFNVQDTFFPFQRAFQPAYRIKVNPYAVQEPVQYEVEGKSDPHSLFEQFFKENEIKSAEEKEFFKKYYP